jgi:hypothetical protein
MTLQIPDDLATEDARTLSLLADEKDALDEAQSILLDDPRFEHLDRIASQDDEIRRFVCLCYLDRSRDHVSAFMEEHGREPEERVCFIPIEALKIDKPVGLLGLSLLPVTDERIPDGGPSIRPYPRRRPLSIDEADHPQDSIPPPAGARYRLWYRQQPPPALLPACLRRDRGGRRRRGGSAEPPASGT